METSADKVRATVFAVLLHVVVGALMFAGLWWSRPTPVPSVRGSVIEAVLVAAPAASAPARSAPPPPAPREEAPPPQPREEPRPQQAPTPPQPQPQAPVQRPDTVERERAARLAQQAEETARREEQERRRQEQVLLEEQRRQEEAEQRQRLSRMEAERQKQLADIRRQREEAERERRLAEERLKQIQDQRRARQVASEAPTEQPPAPVLGNQGTDDSLLGRYVVAIQQAVERNWIRPETIRPGEPCEVRIVQIPGGEVISASVQPACRYDELGRRSVEAAVLRAQPLPYSGYETVFRREINFTFRAPEG